ncbi:MULTISPECIES: DNA sulfur modification protein DndE [Comamonadaceae]|uniref:DNA sulfur modification protein DndE n=2 Tax=Comamonadaceae TaxID=80864 RepID=A0A1P8JRM7_9BURK|nr:MULTISPECIES: DNA sulfur modification protein DndE [Comamonadaceae]APW36406.1 DNA sulfur modification protein DndE [Rhodoferax koreense]MDM0054623.1 DNA sulfur modification protein DndE [Variovorax sp. J22G47]MDM0091585.1 DNA sulfur modification protein DndE [Variovorax sp. J22G40]MDM0148788.1 DNA sulfur modification protein DndE [Variovorax sp. J2P1-31]MDN8616131.1 DNA sulfur modification protein DndE [Variovorax ginsengisoli]
MDRIRLNASAKNQLATLKRRTGIEHNNALCRHALCISLANPSVPPLESFSFGGGIEIDWRTLTGGQDALYLNLLAVRILSEGKKVSEEVVRQTFIQHVHRGLSYLVSRREDDLLVELAKSLEAIAN